jgi:hypothetical protein
MAHVLVSDLWRKQVEKSLDEVARYPGFRVQPGFQNQARKEPPKAVSVTGCLVKGDEPKEVWLAEKSGRIYGLESSKIDLNAHLGHRVILRGYVLPEGKEEAGEEAQKQNKTGKREAADFRVLALKMISTTCTH